ncbi:MAG: helix-turn-helix transcriptional regulator [Clostridiaceae bacterium]
MEKKEEFVDSFIVELNRGTYTLAVLSQLKEPQYGYSLLEELTKKKIFIESSTLYPLLRRLEKQGILVSEWDTTESRPRKYYKLSAYGLEIYKILKNEWIKTESIMSNILREG